MERYQMLVEYRLLIISILLGFSFMSFIHIFTSFSRHSIPSTWPINLEYVNGLYVFKLNYSVGNDTTKRFRVPESKVILGGNPSKYLNQIELEKIGDHRWCRPIDPLVYLAHPQPIDLRDTITKLLYQKPVAERPLNGDVFEFISIPKSVCYPGKNSGWKYNMIVVVKSTVSSFKRRSIFRQVYKDEIGANEFGMLFSIGVPRSKADGIFQRGGYTVELIGNNGELFSPASLKRTIQLLNQEMNEHNDLLIGAYEDTYFNLSIKALYSFTWAATMCRQSTQRPNVIFVDEDVPFSPKAIQILFSQVRKRRRRMLFHGLIESNAEVIRFGLKGDQRWAQLKSEAPWPIYPPYLQGIYFILDFSQVEQVALGMLFTQYTTTDDAWIGLVAARLKIAVRDIRALIPKKDMFLKNQSVFEPVDKKIRFF